MNLCPLCKKPVRPQDAACPHCYAPLKQYFNGKGKGSRPSGGKSPLLRLLVIVLVGVIGGGVVVWLYWNYKVRPRMESIGEIKPSIKGKSRTVRVRKNMDTDFDLTLDLPGGPIGIAARREGMVVGNRTDPWGFLRVVPEGEEKFEISQILVIEPEYNQKMGLSTVTWNGSQYVGYTDGAWFQSKDKNVFTVHDPTTLQVLSYHAAPELLGGLAWDGQNYWAATRKNTEDSDEPAYLYRLNKDFSVDAKYDPPAVGCQGLAWDGSLLWFVDVFSDNIYLIDIRQDPPQLTHMYETNFHYLSGVGYDGSHIWIAEYDGNRLHRLNRVLRSAWLRHDFTVHSVNEASSYVEERKGQLTEGKTEEDYLVMLRKDPYRTSEAVEGLISLGAEDRALQTLQGMLRSEDSSTRVRARSELDQLGAPVPFDRTSPPEKPDHPKDNTEFLDFRIEMAGDSLFGSWEIWFGDELFSEASVEESGEFAFPTFARYTINVEGASGQEPVQLQFDAVPGSNEMQNHELVSSLATGEYSAHIFVHVQYVDAEGTNRIVNHTSSILSIRK